MKRFRPALMEAAEEAFNSDEITRQQLRRIRFASLIPNMAKSMETFVAEEAESMDKLPAGAAANLSAIDWTNLLAFIKELLPLILQLISIFSP